MLKLKILFFLIVISVTTYAHASADNYYLKASASLNKINEIKENISTLNATLKSPSNFSPALAFGVGYYINDSIRADFMLEQSKILFYKESACFSFTEDDVTCKGVAYIKRNTEVKTVMLNGYVDILDRDAFKFFTGAGVGIARIKEGVNRSAIGKIHSPNHEQSDFNYSENSANKVKNNFAYALTFGTSMKLNQGINLELAYTWKNLGMVKHKPLEDSGSIIKNKYRGHYFSSGLRFDI